MNVFERALYRILDSPYSQSILRLGLIAVLAFCTVIPTRAQNQADALSTIRRAVAEGNAKLLLAESTESIELALFAESHQYTRSQATLVLKKFFKENKPTSFELVDSTRSNLGLFVEGRMRTINYQVPLRTYFRLKKSPDGWKLREFLIESPDR